MKLNEIYEVEIIDDNHNGAGITKINNIPVFVKGTLKEDIVKIKITYINKKYSKGEVISFISKSKLHQEPLCPYYKECGGCDLLHTSYDKELELKKNYIKKLFKDFNPEIISLDRTNYRNKITLHVKNNICGLYKEETNEIIPVSKCMLASDNINKVIELLNDFDLTEIEEIVIKEGKNGILLSVTGNIKNKDLMKLIKNKIIKSIYQNNLLIYGDLYIENRLDNIKYLINNNSFFQINNKCAKALYDEIKENIEKTNKLLDLYCGTASIGIYISDICKSVVGVEINKDSVKCAKENIKLNNIQNYKILEGDASIINESFDFVVVDPPRSGLSKEVINNLKNIKSNKIIYVSCNPSTLKRDIDLLDIYKIEKIKLFNMFPGTKHIETLVVLSLK